MRRQANLRVEEMPRRWYNILPDLPEPLPLPKDPDEGESRLAALPKMFLEVSPNLQGEYRYDFADHAETTPLLKMYTLGHKVEMEPIRADGLRYHGCAPILSLLRHLGYIETVAYSADERYVFERARMFVQAEGYLPAPESAYSIACAIDEALRCKEAGESKTIAFNISGHGFMDMQGYREVLGLP